MCLADKMGILNCIQILSIVLMCLADECTYITINQEQITMLLFVILGSFTHGTHTNHIEVLYVGTIATVLLIGRRWKGRDGRGTEMETVAEGGRQQREGDGDGDGRGKEMVEGGRRKKGGHGVRREMAEEGRWRRQREGGGDDRERDNRRREMEMEMEMETTERWRQ
ncbi:uncharacterized protein EDB91DRAFT_1081566 [Suillus paluster]|uniref:uncharacterized protein n=1 Tax=Suillus paluster TaxID=48578 RepID=UPI001B8674F3|nr:uncharacterized protein EDB91DRAFT_1081566 [Suillus paluster]KAG1741754.1 hypothetical protein EDB91DRAFT_1081566 [Suillus paluster]